VKTHGRFSPFFTRTKTAPCMVTQVKQARLYTDSVIVDLNEHEGRILVSDSVLRNPGTHCVLSNYGRKRGPKHRCIESNLKQFFRCVRVPLERNPKRRDLRHPHALTLVALVLNNSDAKIFGQEAQSPPPSHISDANSSTEHFCVDYPLS
jgi:hypothetical protein